MNKILRSIDDLTLDWFNTILPGSRISSFQVESTSEEFCSSIARIRLSFSGSQSGSSIFLKFAKRGNDGTPTGSGRKEVQFYNTYAQTVGHASIPRCFFAEYSQETRHYNIVLEDLSETHDQREWPNTKLDEQYALVAECLAGVHTQWWNRPEAAQMLGLNDAEEERERLEQSTKLAVIPFLRNYSHGIAKPLLKTFTDCASVYDQVVAMKRRSQNVALIHGDTHFWNFLYPKSHGGTVYLVDWESYDLDAPTQDLVKFAAVIWSVEKRKRHEEQFLRTYHKKLTEQGVVDYSFETLLFDYRISILRMLYLPVQKEGWGLPQEIWLEEFENILSAIEDWNCLGAANELVSRS